MTRKVTLRYYQQFHLWVIDAEGQRKLRAFNTLEEARGYLREIAADFFQQGGHTAEIINGTGDLLFAAHSLDEAIAVPDSTGSSN